MEVGKLTVQQRTGTGKGISRRTRVTGDVPGICYGPGLDAPISVTVNPKALKASLDPKKRRNTILNLTIEKESGASVTIKAMVWDYQFNPLRQEITHVDLMSINPDKKISAIVRVAYGETYKGAVDSGILSWERHEVHILAKPADIPSELNLDISELSIGETLHLSDLPLPQGVELEADPGLTIVTCVAPKAVKADKVSGEEASTDEPAKEAEAAKEESK